MTTECVSLLRLRRVRVTRLNGCGQPVYGPAAQVVSGGVVNLTLTPETEDGEDISLKTGSGETCVSEKGLTTVKWYTSKIQFCGVDPELAAIMNPSFTLVYDDQGNVIGYTATSKISDSAGYALEFWTDIASGEQSCSAGAGGQGRWGYFLVPWLVADAQDEMTFENAAMTFTLNGHTKLGSGWRNGPYPVQLKDGAPSGLLTPIGPGDFYRTFWTPLRPPEAECGAQPVDRPTPEPAEIKVQGLGGERPRNSVRLTVDNHGFGPVMVSWGDSTPSQEVADGASVVHKYQTDGPYTITVSDKQTPAISVTRKVTIPLPDDNPVVVPSVDPVNKMIVFADITLPSQSSGVALVSWGDGSPGVDATVGEDGTVKVSHQYENAGVYSITVVRKDLPTYRTRVTVVVPVPDAPTASAVKGADANTAVLTVDNNGNGLTTVDWGDGSDPVDGPATDGGTVTHAYTEDGDYTIKVTSKQNPLAATTVKVTIPFT